MSIRFLYIFLFISLNVFSLTTKELDKLTTNEVFKLGVKAFEKKEYEESLKYWRYLVINNPSNSLFYFNYANAQYETNNLTGAIHGYQRVILLKSTLAPAAKLFLAKAYIKDNKKAKARKILNELRNESVTSAIKDEVKKDLMAIDPNFKKNQEKKEEKKLNAPIEFPIGLTFFKQQNYAMAIKNLEMASKTYDEPELFLVKGISYYKIGDKKRAKRDLEYVVRKTDDPDIRKNANSLLVLLKKKSDQNKNIQKRWTLGGDISLEYNSSPLNLNTIDKDTKDAQYVLLVDGSFQTFKVNKLLSTLQYSGSLEQSFKGKKSRFLEHGFSNLFSTRFGKQSLRLTPRYITQDSGGEPYTKKAGLKTYIDYALSKEYSVSLEHQYLDSEASKEDLNYLTGHNQYYRLLMRKRLDRYNLSLSLTYSLDRFNDEPSNVVSNDGYGANFSLIFYPYEKISLNTNINYLYKKYFSDKESRFVRIDKSTSVSMGVSYNMTKQIGFYFNANISYLNSNLAKGINPENVSAVDEIYDFDEYISIGTNFNI